MKHILFGQNFGSKIWGEEQKLETNSFGSHFFLGGDFADQVLGEEFLLGANFTGRNRLCTPSENVLDLYQVW